MERASTVRIYAAGGGGTNILQNSIEVNKNNKGLPSLLYTVVDTSASNLKKVTDRDISTYLIPGVDGAGGSRKFAFEKAAPHIKSVLDANPPADFNIVITTLSGGTGSTIGPLITSALLEAGENVIVLAIGNDTNAQEATNTLRTIQTFQGIAENIGKPVPMLITNNTSTTPPTMVDGIIAETVRDLSHLLSGSNHGLDSKDLTHWLHFEEVVDDIQPQIITLAIKTVPEDNLGDFEEHCNKQMELVSVATLLVEENQTIPSLGAMYGCDGILPSGFKQQVANPDELNPKHFMLSINGITDLVQTLSDHVKQYEEKHEKLKANTLKIKGGESNGSGFVF